MAALTNAFENKLIDFLLRAQSLVIGGSTAAWSPGAPALYVALFTAVADAEAGSLTEVSGGSYARVSVAGGLSSWNATQGGTAGASSGTDGQSENAGAITFPAPTGNWGQVTHFGLYEASSGGSPLIVAALTTPKTINNGDAAPNFSAGALGFQIDN